MPLLSHKVGQGRRRMLSYWMRQVMTAQFMLSSIKFGWQTRLDVRGVEGCRYVRDWFMTSRTRRQHSEIM